MEPGKPSIKVLICILLFMPVIPTQKLRAQDYQITFAGSGESTTVDSVFVENLTQSTTLKMKGSDILHLKGTVSVFDISSDRETGKITFYPNPMKDHVKMQFILPEAGETMITLYDISGKEIAKTRNLLSGGEHTYSLRDLREGIYLAYVTTGRYSLNGKLISSGSTGNGVKIVHESSAISRNKKADSKGTNDEAVMQYNTGDRLKLMGKSGIYRTIVTDVPLSSKTITYNFIACTDGDGNNYPVVQIGSAKGIIDNPDQSTDKGVQTWMAANLQTKKYTGGPSIPLVTDPTEWASLTTHGYCTGAGMPFAGFYYNWYVVIHGNLCPAGWHIPSDEEWTVLMTNMGGEGVAGGKLKSRGYMEALWEAPNTGATNESGFTAYGASRRRDDGVYVPLGDMAIWWSTMEKDDSNVWCRFVLYKSAAAYRDSFNKRYGMTVRCLHD